ncbi:MULTISPECIES: hypothetical protein [Sutcliffiella]|nr:MULTISPECIES: hypothetical protein [Sutcliffiella]WBL16622.1 hypothetical protein O1A01_08320 [Sutcliffiella sp. NC1]
MGKKKLLYITWAVIIICMLIGGGLAIYLIGKETGEYPLNLFLPMIIGVLGGCLVFFAGLKIKEKRNGNVPDVDERTLRNLQKYFMVVLYVVLFGSGAALIIAFASGVQYIETGLLIVCLMGVYLVVGVGALVAKKI